MEIKIKVEDYFKGLKLMEEQYGLEDELYPWIYMLLKQAECENIEGYKDISIRVVSNGVKMDNKRTGECKGYREETRNKFTF